MIELAMFILDYENESSSLKMKVAKSATKKAAAAKKKAAKLKE